MKLTNFWFIILLVFQTCAPPKVIKFLNDELDYSQYQTYRLINYKSDDKSFDNEGMAFYTQVEDAINQNMTDKGYQAHDRPDLIARYEIVTTTTSRNNATRYDPYNYYDPYYIPPRRNSEKYTEGIILIELRDRKKRKLVWQGSLDLKYSRKIEAHVTVLESINRIFTTYHYQAGSNEKIISK